MTPCCGPTLLLEIMISAVLEDASSKNSAFFDKRFLRKRFLKITNKFFIIFNYLPMDECVTLRFNKLEFPLPNHAKFNWSWHSSFFFRKSRKCKKKIMFRQTQGQTDARQKWIKKAHFRFHLRWAKTSSDFNRKYKFLNGWWIFKSFNNLKRFLFLPMLKFTKCKRQWEDSDKHVMIQCTLTVI